MYDRFTDRARKVMQLAQEEAKRLNHEYIGTEHVLLGLVKEGSGVAACVLKSLHIDLDCVVRETEKLIVCGPSTVTLATLPQTPRVKRVFESAVQEASALNHNFVGSEHILLGLLSEEDGFAAVLLGNFGLTLNGVRAELLQVLSHGLAKRPTAPKVADTNPYAPPQTARALIPQNAASKTHGVWFWIFIFLILMVCAGIGVLQFLRSIG